MTIEVANKEFQKAFGPIRGPDSGQASNEKLMRGFIANLMDYLRGREEWTALAIRSWLRNGGGLHSFRCREDALQPIIDAFIEEQVPFILVRETTGNSGFLIRSCDAARADSLIRKVLETLSNYCEVTTGEQAGIICRRMREKDQKMLILTGLSEQEVYYLKEEAREALPGSAVGIDRMNDGTYMLTCHGQSAFNSSAGHPFKEALMEAKFLANGESAGPLRTRSRKRDEYIEAKMAGFPDLEGGMDSPVWIVGRGDSYVKRTPDGFELGYATDLNGDVFLSPFLEVPLSDSQYEKRLNSALSRITGHICLYSIQDVIEHFRTKKDVFRDPKEAGQIRLIRSASEMVDRRAVLNNRNKRRKENWKNMLEQYREDMAELITAAKEGRIPSGYTKTDILVLRRIIRVFGLDMSRAAPAIDMMRSGHVFEREAGPARVMNIEALLAEIRGEEPETGLGMERDRSRGRSDVSVGL